MDKISVEMKTECVCKTTDLLKDYTILHERIKTLYKILDTPWYLWDSAGLIKFKEDMENASVRRNKIRDIKNEIKRYHRLQSNIQNVLNIVKGATHFVNINRQYNTEEVPSQFKNDMNYTYYCVSYYDKLLILGK